ncbi:DUF3857 domain-containing protein [Maribacter sp. HTCC2170]|uniref:DUF3857 domain-containing protein n=1 Tax=Maribacter sp. (strain HTCC2170 / KCCM 42371) TaxID=313603 RepID=UPI00006B474E|nr:DUF3857 domain-containing protein [Maribacter sp. HTCC2170]EAR01983.1 hypothetical protein FB2170_15683 [Maribacter sp. HTCC2170]
MFPLYFPNSINSPILLVLVLLFTSNILAQDSLPDAKFSKQCKDSEAYILYSYKDVSIAKNWTNFKRHTAINNKVVINNSSGVENHAFLRLSELVANKLSKIKIKTLKADGSVVELDSSLVFQRKEKNEDFQDINYPIPGVEPGDTIETSYEYTEYLKSYQLKDFVNLYSDLPSIRTEYTVRTNPELQVRYKNYNDFPNPDVIANDTLTYCVFKMDKVNRHVPNENTCLPCDLPYVYYSIEKKDKEPITWKEVYNAEFNVVTQPMALDHENISYYKRWKKRVIGEAKDSSKFHKFKLLHQDILENLEIVPTKMREMIKSSGFFLKEKRIDPIGVGRLYRQLLEDLQIDYWAVFARSKREGPIDPYYIRKGEYDHIFFAFENEKGGMELLYPHEEAFKYQINEIPTSLYNSEAIIAKPYFEHKIKKGDKFIGRDLKLAEVDSVAINMIKLPGSNVKQNYIKQLYFSEINLNEKSTLTKYKFSVSGGLSTDVRGFYSMLNQDEEASDFYDAMNEYEGSGSSFKMDSLLSTHFRSTKPFTFTINGQGNIDEAVSFLTDSMVSVSLNNLIQHSQLESDQNIIDLNYYLDYNYSDHSSIILNFTDDIELLDIEKYKLEFSNEIGSYSVESKIIGNNRLNLQSNYRINKDFISIEEYPKLKELNKKVNEMINNRLIIKLKNK